MLALLLVSLLPLAGLILLFVLMNRWGRKHDPLGGRRPGNILPLDGASKRPDTYHD